MSKKSDGISVEPADISNSLNDGTVRPGRPSSPVGPISPVEPISPVGSSMPGSPGYQNEFYDDEYEVDFYSETNYEYIDTQVGMDVQRGC